MNIMWLCIHSCQHANIKKLHQFWHDAFDVSPLTSLATYSKVIIHRYSHYCSGHYKNTLQPFNSVTPIGNTKKANNNSTKVAIIIIHLLFWSNINFSANCQGGYWGKKLMWESQHIIIIIILFLVSPWCVHITMYTYVTRPNSLLIAVILYYIHCVCILHLCLVECLLAQLHFTSRWIYCKGGKEKGMEQKRGREGGRREGGRERRREEGRREEGMSN